MYINSNNHSLLMKQVNLVPWGSSRQKLGLLSVIHAEYSTQPLAVQPPVSDHPNVNIQWKLLMGGGRLRELSHRSLSTCRSGSNTCIYNWERLSLKTESTRKLSNFNFQWTKTLYQNNLQNIAFFFHYSRAKDVINHLW